MSDPISVDLDDTTGCRRGDRCQRCATATGLAVCTAYAMGGMVCLTLCPTCDPPRLGPTTAALMTLAHCEHLGIDLDRMAAQLAAEVLYGRPVAEVVYGPQHPGHIRGPGPRR